MIEKENTILKNLDRRVGVLDERVVSLDKKVESLDKTVDGLSLGFDKKLDRFALEFEEKVGRVERRVDGRMLLIVERMNSLAKKADERMDRFAEQMAKFDESNRKNGMLLEKLDGKFDLSVEGYLSLRDRTEKLEDRVNILEGHGAF